MMGWYGWNHMSGWGWFTMMAGGLLLLALVVGCVVLLVARVGQQPPRRYTPVPPPSAEELLAERFARGEITEDEYRQRLAVLAGSGHYRTPTT